MATSQGTLAEGMAGQLHAEPSRLSRWWRWTKWFFTHKPLGAVSAVVSLFMVIVAVGAFTGIIVPQDPIKVNGADRLMGFMSESLRVEGQTYIFGTDELGRDMFSRIVKGAQISVFFALGACLISVSIGGVIGLMSAYFGGKFDLLVQRFIDAIQTIPFLVLAIAIVSILGPGLWQGFWTVALVGIPRPARVIRGSVLSAKENVWAEAARSIGASDRRVMFRHILPNVAAPMIVLATYVIAVAVLIEASLSFLGIGAQPPTPSWGAMLTGTGRLYFETHPRLAMLPGIAISVLVFGTNMFGDSLRDILDPKLRGR